MADETLTVEQIDQQIFDIYSSLYGVPVESDKHNEAMSRVNALLEQKSSIQAE